MAAAEELRPAVPDVTLHVRRCRAPSARRQPVEATWSVIRAYGRSRYRTRDHGIRGLGSVRGDRETSTHVLDLFRGEVLAEQEAAIRKDIGAPNLW
jgi:hypothetical protein